MERINNLNRFNKKNIDFIRRFTAGVRQIDIDISGRILIPKDLINHAKIKKEVVVSSAVNILEIWDKTYYENAIDDAKFDFGSLAEEVMGIKMNNTYHIPVLLKESINGLNILPNGVYVDATFGGGGHTKEILNHLNSSGKVIAFDQDADAIENQIDDNRLKLIKSNFKYLTNHLKYLQINKIDGLLADFGISSYQIDTRIRGFSIRFDSDLDMRMNKDQKRMQNKY